MTIIEWAVWLKAHGDSRAKRVQRLAVELALEGDEVLVSEECHS